MRWFVVLTLIAGALAFVPAASAQKGCSPFYSPPGVETGNFNTGVWESQAVVFWGSEVLSVHIFIQDNGGPLHGKTANSAAGTESALYDFGDGNTFQTFIKYVVQHNNDPDKFHLNAVETIITGSGTGRFVGASGTVTAHGDFGITDWNTFDGWALFTLRGSVCVPPHA